MTDAIPGEDDADRAIASTLRTSSPTAARLVQEHQEYFEEILSTVLLADIGRWYWSAVQQRDSEDAAEALRATRALAGLYAEGDDEIQTAIATGFLEALPHPDEDGRAVVERLPTVLREQLRRMEDWRPSED